MKSIDEYVQEYIQVPYDRGLSLLNDDLNKTEELRNDLPKTIDKFPEYFRMLNKHRDKISSDEFKLDINGFTEIIASKQLEDKIAFNSDKNTETKLVDDELDELIKKREYENKSANETLKRGVDEDNHIYDVLKTKQNHLLQYSDKIMDLCAANGIKLSNLELDQSELTVDDIDEAYDSYIQFLSKDVDKTNIIDLYRNLIKDPLWQAAGLVVVLFLLMTKILDFLSIAYFVLLIYSQTRAPKRVKYYTLLMYLVYKINIDSLGRSYLDQSLLKPEELTDDVLDILADEDPEFSSLYDKYDDINERYDENIIDTEQAKYLNEYSLRIKEIESKINSCNSEYIKRKESGISRVDELIKFATDKFNEYKANYKDFGERFSNDLTFNSSLLLGSKDYIDEFVDIGLKNIIIRPHSDEVKFNKFLQCLIVNAFSNVKPKQMKIYVFDPNGFGKSVMPLYINALADYFIILNDDLNDVLDTLIEQEQDNLKVMGGKTSLEYNKMCQETGKTPIAYNLLLVLSQPKSIEEDEKLKSLFEYSADGGVFLWVVSDVLQSTNAHVFRRPFDGVKNEISLTINDEWCHNFAINFADAIEKASPDALMWEDCQNVLVPDEKTWTGITDNEASMYPGYEEGDPSMHRGYSVGNTGNVHILCVGGTGAGKSVFLNHTITMLTKLYSPKELELWMCDFKGTEFGFFMKSEAFPYSLPHIKACLCTSDGMFATSLFHAIRTVADHRYDIMKDPNMFANELAYNDGKTLPAFKDTRGWNEYWRKQASDSGNKKYLDNIWPRIFFICDEFQVIFEKTEGKEQDSIKADITQLAKVARACNVNIFFTSQSMKKTVSADILAQFTMRFALRCDTAVSQDIIGTKRASTEDGMPVRGYVVCVDANTKPDQQPRFRTPWARDDILRSYIKSQDERAHAENIPPKYVITYSEQTKHDISEIDDWYANEAVMKQLPDSGVFFIGPRMAYSENKAPDNIIMPNNNNENIFAVFNDLNDLGMFYNSIVRNIKNNKVPGVIIGNSQVEDLAIITKMEDDITYKEKHGRFVMPKGNSCKSVLDFIKKMLELRKDAEKKDPPIWVILLGWDKGSGIGIEPDSGTRSQFNILLQTAGEYGIHFIVLCTSTTGIQSGTINACKYRLAGMCSNDDSISTIGKNFAGKSYDMKTGWFFIFRSNEVSRCKIYISELKGEVQKHEIVV